MRKLLICQYSLKYYAVIFVQYVSGDKYNIQHSELLDKTELIEKNIKVSKKKLKKNRLASKM